MNRINACMEEKLVSERRTRCSISTFMSHDMRKMPFLAHRMRTPGSIHQHNITRNKIRQDISEQTETQTR